MNTTCLFGLAGFPLDCQQLELYNVVQGFEKDKLSEFSLEILGLLENTLALVALAWRRRRQRPNISSRLLTTDGTDGRTAARS